MERHDKPPRMSLDQDLAGRAGRCRYSVVDALTLPDGTFVPMYACTNLALTGMVEQGCVLLTGPLGSCCLRQPAPLGKW